MAVYQARNLLTKIEQHVDDDRERLSRLIADWGRRVIGFGNEIGNIRCDLNGLQRAIRELQSEIQDNKIQYDALICNAFEQEENAKENVRKKKRTYRNSRKGCAFGSRHLCRRGCVYYCNR